MVNIKLNNVDLEVEESWTILDTARFYGLRIPTLCYNEGLSVYGGCRLCLVEIGEGLVIRTDTRRVIAARRMMIELLVSVAPGSKVLQDLASKFGVTRVRFKPRWEECILCGLCTRMCHEQMDAQAIGFVNRGKDLRITTPFDARSEKCRQCGGCIYICPACQLRCQGPQADTTLCNACLTMDPTCLDFYDDLQCWMYDAGQCGTCVREKKDKDK
jgi:bidirectional [NiFe] hydrogenase diaphorase subunit